MWPRATRVLDRAEDCRASDAVHHRPWVAFPQRGYPENDIIQYFGEDAAEAEHHAGAELGIPDHASHELTGSFDLGLHQDADQRSRSGGLDGSERRYDFGAGGEVQLDGSGLRLWISTD